MFKIKTEIKALLIVLTAILFFIIEDKYQQVIFFTVMIVLIFANFIAIPYISIIRNKKYIKHTGTIVDVDLVTDQSVDSSFYYTIRFTLNEIEHLHTLESKSTRKAGEQVRFYIDPANTEYLKLEDDITRNFVEGASFTFILSGILLYHIIKK